MDRRMTRAEREALADLDAAGRSRRTLLRTLGAAGVVIGSGGGSALLSACAGSSSGSGAGGGASSTTAAAVAAGVVPFDPSKPFWHQGNFAPVHREVTAHDLEV